MIGAGEGRKESSKIKANERMSKEVVARWDFEESRETRSSFRKT